MNFLIKHILSVFLIFSCAFIIVTLQDFIFLLGHIMEIRSIN